MRYRASRYLSAFGMRYRASRYLSAFGMRYRASRYLSALRRAIASLLEREPHNPPPVTFQQRSGLIPVCSQSAFKPPENRHARTPIVFTRDSREREGKS